MGRNFEKQHNQRRINLTKVKQCTEAPPNFQVAKVRVRVYVCAKAKCGETFKCETYARKVTNVCFRGSVEYRQVDLTVWNHNTLPSTVTLDPLECKTLSDKSIEFIANYRTTFNITNTYAFGISLLPREVRTFETPFNVYKRNTMYAAIGTFTFISVDKTGTQETRKIPLGNCLAHQFEVYLVTWRYNVSKVKLAYDDTANVMIQDRHILPCYFVDGFCGSS